MITLKEAFKLCGIDLREVVHLAESIDDSRLWNLSLTGQEVREKYDMRNTMVSAIRPYFCCGDYEGFVFVIQKKEKNG